MIQPGQVLQIPFLSDAECAQLISYAEKKKVELQEDAELLNLGTFDNISKSQITTALYNSYSVMGDHPWMALRLSDIVSNVIPHFVRPFLVQSWVNIYDTGEGINWHTHEGRSLHSYTANVFLGGDPEPGLIVGNYGCKTETIKNQLGCMLLMNCDHPHMVPPVKAASKRYTVGMTLHDYHALTPSLLQNVAINSRQGSILIG